MKGNRHPRQPEDYRPVGRQRPNESLYQRSRKVRLAKCRVQEQPCAWTKVVTLRNMPFEMCGSDGGLLGCDAGQQNAEMLPEIHIAQYAAQAVLPTSNSNCPPKHSSSIVTKFRPNAAFRKQNSAQTLSFFPCCILPTAQLPAPNIPRSSTLYIVFYLPLPQGLVSTTSETSDQYILSPISV
jgi:hypothetical protein